MRTQEKKKKNSEIFKESNLKELSKNLQFLSSGTEAKVYD